MGSDEHQCQQKEKVERRTKSVQEADLVICCFVKLHPPNFATQVCDGGRNRCMTTQDLQYIMNKKMGKNF